VAGATPEQEHGTMNAIPKIKTTTKLIVGYEEVASVEKTLSISANVSLTNVQQVGSHFQGEIDLNTDTGIGSLDFSWPFDIDTGLGNPIDVDLGVISLPLIGDVDVVAEFSYDLNQRQVCVALTLEGLLTIGKTCVNF
jgi:hypothetical protein